MSERERPDWGAEVTEALDKVEAALTKISEATAEAAAALADLRARVQAEPPEATQLPAEGEGQ